MPENNQKSAAQPWQAVWPENKEAKPTSHEITYGFRKGTRMSVNGTGGAPGAAGKTLQIVYDTADRQ